MDKILVTVYVLCLDSQYDILIPINLSVENAIKLIQQAVDELTSHAYRQQEKAFLYNEDGNVINSNNIVKFSGLKNGSKVMLV